MTKPKEKPARSCKPRLRTEKKKIRQFENREKDVASEAVQKRNAEHAATALSSGAQSLKALCRKQRT